MRTTTHTGARLTNAELQQPSRVQRPLHVALPPWQYYHRGMDHALDADFCTRKCIRRTAIRAHRPMGPSGICQGSVEARPVCVCGQRRPLHSATCCPQRTGMAVLKNGHPNVVTEWPGRIHGQQRIARAARLRSPEAPSKLGEASVSENL